MFLCRLHAKLPHHEQLIRAIARKTVQCVKCMLHKYEGLSSIPGTHTEKKHGGGCLWQSLGGKEKFLGGYHKKTTLKVDL